MPKLSDPSHGVSGEGLEQVALEGDSLGDYRSFWDRSAELDAIRAISDQDTDTSFESSGTNDVTGLEPYLPADGSGRVLEIGCGIGRILQHLAPRCRELHGVDISAEMIKKGETRLKDVPNLHLHVGNGYDLGDFEDGTFDLVYSHFVLQHMPKTTAFNYFKETARVLRTGGAFRFQVPNILTDEGFHAFHHFTQPWFVEHPYPMNFYSPSEVLSLLTRAGFWVEDVSGTIVAVARLTGTAGASPDLVRKVAGLEQAAVTAPAGQPRRGRLAAVLRRALRPGASHSA